MPRLYLDPHAVFLPQGVKYLYNCVQFLLRLFHERFLQNVTDSDNTVCSLFVYDATSELLCLCNAYSANKRNITERIIQSGFAL